MRKTPYFIVGFLVLCALIGSAAKPRPSAAEDRLGGKALVEALRRGGYALYFRHAATDWSQADRVRAEGDWTSCDPGRMRQLSEEGREQARRIGEAIRRLGIPVGRVRSSEYCRARHTAELMGLGPVVTTRSLMNMLAADFVGGTDAVVERARREIGAPPREGTNTVLVAHGNLMRAATGEYTDEGGAVVLEPRGDGTFTVVAVVARDEWERLAEKFGQGGE